MSVSERPRLRSTASSCSRNAGQPRVDQASSAVAVLEQVAVDELVPEAVHPGRDVDAIAGIGRTCVVSHGVVPPGGVHACGEATGFEPGARSVDGGRRGPLPCRRSDGVPLQPRRPHRDARHGGSVGVRGWGDATRVLNAQPSGD